MIKCKFVNNFVRHPLHINHKSCIVTRVSWKESVIVVYRSILGLTPHTLLLATVGPAGLRVTSVISVLRRPKNVVFRPPRSQYGYNSSQKVLTNLRIYESFTNIVRVCIKINTHYFLQIRKITHTFQSLDTRLHYSF